MTETMHIRIGTRKSPLALWQAEHVRDLLAAAFPGDTHELVPISTRGDAVLDRALSAVGGKGLFTKELEDAMLDGRADCAAHSLKDLPTELPDGLALACVLPREDPRDAMIGCALDALPHGSRVGTSSLRRQAQLLALRPDLIVEPVRGNVATRLRKLDEGNYDALCMAAIGFARLQYQDRVAELLDVDRFIPAVGQGAIAVECRAGDTMLMERLAAIGCAHTQRTTAIERAVLHTLEGGCQTPIGVHCIDNGDTLRVRAMVGSTDGRWRAYAHAEGTQDQQLARQVCDELFDKGYTPQPSQPPQ